MYNIKRYIFILFLLAIIISTPVEAEIFSAYEAIESHREWMRQNTPSPDEIGDEELLTQVIDIIDLNLQEPEAYRLLIAAAKKVPEVMDYLNWTATLECDTLFQKRRGALRGISEYLNSTAPESFGARNSLLSFIRQESIFNNMMTDFDNLIAHQQKICSKTDSKEEKALLLQMQLARFSHRCDQEGADNQLHYPELWDLEKEVLKLYPPESTDTVKSRIELYCALADIKQQPQSAEKVRLMFPDDFNPYDNNTRFEYTGTFKDYLCNSGYYYEEAIELASRLYGQYHPYTACIAFNLNRFRLFNTVLDPDLAETSTNLFNFLTLYYPRKSLEAKHSVLLMGFLNYLKNGYTNIENEYYDLTNIFSTYYGDNSPFYLNSLILITTLFLNPQADYIDLINRYDEACKRIAKTKIEEAMWKIFIYTELNHINPQLAAEYIGKLKDIYLKSADGTPISVDLGENLLTYYYSQASNFDIAAEVAKVLAEDNRKLFGDPSPQYFLARRNIFQMSATGTDPSELKYIDNLIKESESKKYNASAYTQKLLKESKALYFWSNNRYNEAQKEYASLHKNNFSEENMLPILRDAICRAYTANNFGIADKLASVCREYADTTPTNIIVPQFLIELSEYYQERGRMEDAVAMLEKSLEAHDTQLNGVVDNERYSITSELASLYEITNNRVAASRLIASDREDIQNQVRKFPSIQYIGYLNGQFDRALRRQDYNAAGFYFAESMQAANSLIAASNNSIDVKFKVLPEILLSVVKYYDFIYRLFDEFREQLETDEFKIYKGDAERTLESIAVWQPIVKEGLLELEKEYPEYNPNYADNMGYASLLTTIGGYYISCEKDYKKGEEYMLRSLSIYNNPIDIKNSYYNLATIMYDSGNKEKGDEYRAKAYEIVEKHPDRMGDSERMGALGFRFSQSMVRQDYDAAESTAREIYRQNRKMLDGNFQLMSTADQEVMFNTFGDPAWAIAALLEKKPESLSGEVYDAIVYRTGMQLRSQQETRRLISASDNPEIHSLSDSIAALRAVIKTINITPDKWGTEESQQDYKRISDLTFRAERLEQQLLESIREMRGDNYPDITWQMIQNRLKPGEAAIEFIFSYSRIMALILTRDCTMPIAVNLCDIKDFSEQLAALKTKNSAALARRLYGEELSLDLYPLLWQPLESHLKDIKTIFFSAPGMLHSIAFNAISSPENGYLIDRYDLRQLTTTAQLTIEDSDGKPKSASLVGDVLFDPSQEKSVGIIPDVTGERSVDEDYTLFDSMTLADLTGFEENRGVVRQHFRYLPFTAKELDDITKSLEGVKHKTLRQQGATEEAFRNLCADSPELLHLATHGFFLSTEAEAMKVPFMRKFPSAIGSAMQRSGIALANAEQSWSGKADLPEDSDGILTASEVASLNLRNTRLVTLSACETALGGYNFEGIHGLTRGFKQAGAKSLLVSLWSVNDRSTSLFMSSFYHEWIKTGDRHSAYKKAIESVRASYPAPFYWAPFILLD